MSEPGEYSYSKTHFAPKMWLKLTLDAWLRILVEARCRISLNSLHSLFFITTGATITSVSAVIEWLRYHRRIDAVQLEKAPIFIIGHWRSGTTLLHELISLDEELDFPTTFACFNPRTFLTTQSLGRWFFDKFMPERRPMDGMLMGIDRPQEDEFALCMLGVASPYRSLVFPNLMQDYRKYFRISTLGHRQISRWEKALTRFFRKVTLDSGKRLVLKSPTHSFRIDVLSRLFPGARFVFVRRDPYRVFKSTQHLWMTLMNRQGLHNTDPDLVRRYVLEVYPELLDAVEQDRQLIADDRFCEVSFEDLVSDPVATVSGIYSALGLAGFDDLRPQIEEYQRQNREYSPNAYTISDDDIRDVNEHWGHLFEKQGYPLRELAPGDAGS